MADGKNTARGATDPKITPRRAEVISLQAVRLDREGRARFEAKLAAMRAKLRPQPDDLPPGGHAA
ncbi:MAG: hypothetical protein RIS94_1867 [Pseudomonadota bacterium]|jgi:hypothetical protein